MVEVAVAGQTGGDLLLHHGLEADWEGDQAAQDQVPQRLTVVVHVQEEVGDDGGDSVGESVLRITGVSTVVEEGSQAPNSLLSV